MQSSHFKVRRSRVKPVVILNTENLFDINQDIVFEPIVLLL